jgi:rfaE bifunctional protein kinase chain/domain
MTDAAALIRANTPKGARIAFVSGNFNILHPGHLRLLKFASELAEYVVVGLRPDETPGVTVAGAMRLESVQALSIVDAAVLLDEDVTAFIARLRPDFVVKGKEFQSRANPEAETIAGYGGKLIFSSGEMQFASMELLRNEYTDTVFSTIRKPKEFPIRHDFEMADLRTLLDKVTGMRVAVVGDVIIDDYITCDPLGMSQEDPTIVVTPIETKTFVGGAGVVALHAKSLGAVTSFFTVFGNDESASYAADQLGAAGVEVFGFTDETRPTTRKQRFRAHNKTLLRVNHLRQHAVSDEIVQNILARMESVLPNIDLLMFSDFNYGCLPQVLVDGICAIARKHGVVMTADSQASSQVSDISRFKGMMLVTPTEREARLALQDTVSGLAVLAEELRKKGEVQNVIITLGGEGILVHGPSVKEDFLTDRLPAFNMQPKDVAGAGDSLFTATSMALCSGADVWSAAYLGSVAAACQVSRVGNSPLRAKDILIEINQPD